MQSGLQDIKAGYRVVAKGLVRDDAGQLLLLRERGDLWDLPGGGLEHGETIAACLEREFAEELNVGVVIDLASVKVYPTWNTKFDDPVLIVAYEVQLAGEPMRTVDVEEFGYFTLDEVKKVELDSTLRPLIEDFYRTDG